MFEFIKLKYSDNRSLGSGGYRLFFINTSGIRTVKV